VRRKLRWWIPLVAGVAFTLVGYSAASGTKSTAKDTLVFAGSADPALLDPSLVSDGESLRVTDQIFNSLVGFKLGGTQVVPELATGWKVS
jgi:peptide/nickel transport system substrate-binding protein